MIPKFHVTVLSIVLLSGLQGAPAMMVNVAGPYNVQPSPPRSKDVVFYAPEQPDFMFDHGKTVTIWCQPVNRALSLDWALCRNRVITPIRTGTSESLYDNSFKISIPTENLKPAFYDLKVTVHQTEKLSVTGITGFGWRALEEPMLPVVPKDFKAFWREEKRKVDQIPLDLKVTLYKTLKGDEIGAYNMTQAALPESYDPEGEKYKEIEIYKVDFAGANGLRIYGWFTKPVGKGPFPAILVLPGAGNGPRPAPVDHAAHGYAALDIQVHNQPVDMPKEQYPKVVKDTVFTTVQDYSFYQVYLNLLQGPNALVQLPGVDPNRMVVLGGSQGGRGSVIMAAMDPRFKGAVIGIANGGNMPWIHWFERLNMVADPGDRDLTDKELLHDDQQRIESYFDIMNFAPMIRCPVLFNSGLIDPVSPPTSVFSEYLRIQSPKQMITMPNLGHDFSPAFDRYAWKWIDQQLNKSNSGPAGD